MEKNELIQKLKACGIHTKAHYLHEAFSRNIGLITLAEQARLHDACVAIPGMGGVGGVHLMTLIRMGVGHFHLADFDRFEAANINRQYGARVPDFGRNKLNVMKETALSVNPYAEIRTFPEGISDANLDDFLDGVQVVLDSLDYFEFDIRRRLFNRAREKGVYVITAGPIGFSSAMLIFSPHEGMGFDEYFNIVSGMTSTQHYLAYAIGLAPRATQIKYMDLSRVDFDDKAGPSSIAACQLCAGMAATEAMRIILDKGKIKPVPYYFQFDSFRQMFCKGKIRGGNRHPFQRAKLFVVGKMLSGKKKILKPRVPSIPMVSGPIKDIPGSVLTYILEAGIQAPSGDNVQPWKFKVLENSILVFLDRDADNSFFNVNQIASVISCGAVIENMKIAGSMFGLDADIEILPEEGNSDFMAKIVFKAEDMESDPLSGFIWERCTNRKFYSGKNIPDADLVKVKDAISLIPGTRLHIISDRDKLKDIARLVYKADRIRTEHRPLHEHLNKMIRFTLQDAEEKRDGFPLKNLEAGLAGELFLKTTRPWFVMSMANRLWIGRMVAMHAKMGVLRSSGVGLITVDGTKNENFLMGGRSLERVWLTLTRLGIYFQPMAAVNLFWMRWLLEGENDFLPGHRSLLKQVWRTYQEVFPEVDFTSEGHIMLFRFGYGKPIKQRTIRKENQIFIV